MRNKKYFENEISDMSRNFDKKIDDNITDEELKEEIKKQKEEKRAIKWHNVKIYSTRALKTIRDFTLVTLPFTVGVTACVIATTLTHTGGLPFHKDYIREYHSRNGYMDSKGGYHESIGDYKDVFGKEYIRINIYTPWKEKNGSYERMVYSYNVKAKEKELKKLEEYVKSGDHEGLRTIVENPYISKETTNKLNSSEKNDYFVTAEYLIRSDKYKLELESDSTVIKKSLLTMLAGFFTEVNILLLLATSDYMTPSEIADEIYYDATEGVTYSTREKKKYIKSLKSKRKS